MSVSALPTRPGPSRPRQSPRQVPSRRHSPSSSMAEDPTLTVSLVITLTGDNRFGDAARVLDTLRQVTSQLDGAEIGVSPPLALARPPSIVDERPADKDQVLILVESREVRLGNRVIPFTRIEFDLLRFLAEHPRQVFTREQLLRHVWGFAHGGHRTVDVHVRRLRAKFGDREVATTVRGVGYRLADDANLRVVHLS